MSEAPPPSKRTRSIFSDGEEAPDGPPASSAAGSLKHDEEFWFEDGNIVLVSRDTAFRIYRGLLAAQSSVFANMFTAASSRADESYEGYPIIHLTESPEDLRHLLRVLLPKSHRSFVSDGCQTSTSFEQIFAVVRMSHKYQVDDIFQQAISRLKRYYTVRPDTSTPIDSFTPTQAIGVVSLAVLTDTPVILPLALLQCASLGSSVLDGWTREDGSVEHLSPGHLRLVLDARDRLIMESFYSLKKVFGASLGIYCGNWEACRNKMFDMLLVGMDMGNANFEPSMMFGSWEHLLDGNPLCTACMKEIRKNQEDVLTDLWRRLPTFFHLNIPGWPEIL